MIEIIRRPRTCPRLAVFDFDGTLSLVRAGWQPIMSRLMVEVLHEVSPHEAAVALERRALQFIAQSTGQPTLEQMSWLTAEVARRGAVPESAAEYKRRFEERLHVRVERRLDELRQGRRSPDAFLVPGAHALLQELRERKMLLALVSGTDRVHVVREAGALRIAGYFDAGVYSPGPHEPAFSKPAAIARLLSATGLSGAQLVGFGDGPVETVAVRAAGGLAVGIALDEIHGDWVDADKRAALIAAGADVIVPHFGDRMQLVALLCDTVSSDERLELRD